MNIIPYINKETSWSFQNLNTNKTQYLTHGYHRYPAKFIPQLVFRLIKEYSKPGDRICDPFGGCGTTLVEAKLAKRPSIGFDINPLAILITKAKTTPISPIILTKRFSELTDRIGNEPLGSSRGLKTHINHDRLLYWFNNSNLERLLSLKSNIEKEKVPAIRRFFLCAFSHILKNCSYWLSKSTKPQKNPNKVPDSPLKVFKKHVSYMMSRNEDFFKELKKYGSHDIPAIMKKADARSLPLPNDCLDLIITSPPYSTSYEYPDIHQLSALLFGFCSSVNEFRRNFIGSRGNFHNRDEILTNPLVIEAIKDLKKEDASLAKAISNYFVDMNKVYNEIHRVLRKGKRACIVIGDTELRGISIPNMKVAIDQMREAGFKLEKIIKRPISGRVLTPFRNRNNGRFTSPKDPTAKKVYSHEYIIVMRKK
ncbi:MAG: DNA methyltransferase [Candidatus Hodarchaeota archaeon]